MMNDMLTLLENDTNYDQEALLVLAQRDNNSKRKFLLVNRLQGKHLATDPKEALQLFALLGEKVKAIYQNQRVVVIGFAETATAIGAAVAAQFPGEILLLQTSREQIDNACNLVHFEEEHSHATMQKLYCTEPQRDILRNAEVVLFVEDEVTTGKTILNFVEALVTAGHLNNQTQFAVASLVNGLSDELLLRYQQQKISYHYLMRGQYHADLDPYPQLQTKQPWQPAVIDAEIAKETILVLSGKKESRSGIVMKDYEAACIKLGQQLITHIEKSEMPLKGHVLLLGTEEFMYPVIKVAAMLQSHFSDCTVVTHATTRSPIKISRQGAYPIFNGSKIDSLYEAGRQTFVYNLQPYDQVIWITDAVRPQAAGTAQLHQALRYFGCKDILGVNWVE